MKLEAKVDVYAWQYDMPCLDPIEIKKGDVVEIKAVLAFRNKVRASCENGYEVEIDNNVVAFAFKEDE